MSKILKIMGDVSGSINESLNNATGSSDRQGIDGIFQSIAAIIIVLVGIVAVVMIILGGIQYSTSQGDPGKVKKAKDTIMYGIIGLIVAILAFAIVTFVLNNVFR